MPLHIAFTITSMKSRKCCFVILHCLSMQDNYRLAIEISYQAARKAISGTVNNFIFGGNDSVYRPTPHAIDMSIMESVLPVMYVSLL